MSSFYAGIMGGGAAATDYNSLKDVPITNVGNESSITNLATLTTGHYALKGMYTPSTESSDEIGNSSVLDVVVLNDTVRNTHIVQFMTVDNGEVFFNIYTYDEDNQLVKQEKISLTAPSHSSWGDI